MMEPKMSAAGLITIGTKKTANFVAFVSFIIFCIIQSWIITFQEFYSCFHLIFHFFSYLFLKSWKSSDQNVIATLNPCPDNNITREDLEIVMENLGLVGHELKEALVHDSFDIANVFDGREPSLDELKEVFGIFDKNDDGFIDAEELKKVVSSIGLTGISEQECRRMIMAYDDNGDEKIDFGEFVKLMEDCSC